MNRTKRKSVLIACEYSGRVRDAMQRVRPDLNVISCDILPSEGDADGKHIQGDLLDVLGSRQWEAIIGFPPCTHLAVSGARYFADKRKDGRQRQAIEFVKAIWDSADLVAIENPVGILNSYEQWPELRGIGLDLPRPQYVQPWQFGQGTQKKTGLWLKGLPPLVPTDIVEGRRQEVWLMGPSADRAKKRSITPQGIADAMAEQWGKLV